MSEVSRNSTTLSSPPNLDRDASIRYAKKKVKKAYNKKIYYHSQLILAIITILSYIGTVVSTAFLLYDYFEIKNILAAPIVICALYAWKTVIQVVIELLSTGPSFVWIFDLLQISELVSFIRYLMHWKKHNGDTIPWKRAYYLPHQPFVSTVLSIPSLIIQSWILLEYPNDWNPIQIVCIVFTSIHAFSEQMCAFFYISVSPRIYNIMAFSTIFSMALRCATGGFLIYSIKEYVFAWWFGSYLIGIFLLIALWRSQKRHKKDDPLQLGFLKFVWTHQVALHLTFSSIPFASQHSVMEFWVGYILGELKLLVEYGIAVGIIALTFPYTRGFEFYTIYGVGCAFILVYAGFIYFTNMAVSRALRRRSLFSTTKIITLFVLFGNWFQEKRLGKQADGGLDSASLPANRENDANRTSGTQDANYEAHIRQFGHMTSQNNLLTSLHYDPDTINTTNRTSMASGSGMTSLNVETVNYNRS